MNYSLVSGGTCILPSVYFAFQLAEVLLNVSVVCELRKHDASNLICSLSWLFWLFSSFVFRANFVIISSTSVKNAFCAADLLHAKPQPRTVRGVKVACMPGHLSQHSVPCSVRWCPGSPCWTCEQLWCTTVLLVWSSFVCRGLTVFWEGLHWICRMLWLVWIQ